MKMIQNKRGVSPIIAAVLLVVITIAIGATTMAFIRSLADTNLETAGEKATRISCGSDLEIDIPVVDNAYKICYYSSNTSSGGGIQLLAHNTGTVDIKGFVITLLLNNGTVNTHDFTTGYAVAKNAYVNLNLSHADITVTNTSDIDQWRIEPKIYGAPGKGDTICADVAIIRDSTEIDACT